MAASNTIYQRIGIEGAVDVINQLRNMGAAGEAAIRQIQTATGAAVSPLVALHGATERAHESIQRTAGVVTTLEGAIGPAISRLNRFTESFAGLRGVIGALSPAMKEFAEIGIGAGFLLAARSAASATRDLVDQARNLGTTVKDIEGLKYAFASVGVGAEAFNRIIDRLAARLGEAQRKSEDFKQAQSVAAQEREIQLDKLASSIRKDEEAEAASRRQQQTANEELKRATLEHEKLNIATRERVSGTEKLREATDKLYNAQTGANLQTNLQAFDNVTKAKQMDIKVGETRLALESQLRRADETQISALNAQRSAQDRLRQSRDEFALTETKARIESEKSKDEFTRLGIELRKSGGDFKSVKEVLFEFSDKLNALPNAAERANIMLKVFGRNWAEAGRAMKLGSDRMRELQEQFEKTGAEMTDREVEMGEEFNQSWEKLLSILEGMKNIFGNILGQVFVPLFDHISHFFEDNQKLLREFANGFSNILAPAVKTVLTALEVPMTVLRGLFEVITERFTRLAEVINKFAGTDLTRADIMVSLGAMYLLAGRIAPVLALARLAAVALTTEILSLGKAFISFGKAIVTLDITASLLTPMGLLKAVIVAVKVAAVAVAAAILLWPETFGPVIKWFKEGLDNLIGTAKALYELLHAIAVLQGWASGASAPSSDGGSLSTEDFGKRVEAENPQLYQHKAGGGSILGSGSGDHVPVLAEPGEFMVRRSIATPWRGFLEALNAGLVRGFAMGGVVDALSNIGPTPLSAGLPAAKPSDDRALFHLTIDGRSFERLSAPRDTAEALLSHARTSSLISAARPPSRKGR